MTDRSDATQVDADAQSQADTVLASESQAESQPETISLEEAKKLRSEAASLRKRLRDAESKAQAAEEKDRAAAQAKAQEEGDFKKLYEDAQAKYADLEAQLKTRDLRDRKAAAARKHNLPDDLADRLSGQTDEELEADAKALAKHIAPRESVDNDAGKRSAAGKGAAKTESYLESYQFGKRPIT
jgi:hypothetical protein